MSQVTVAAADLGASSGRVMTGRVGDGRLELREVHRFANRPVSVAGTLHWDILRLFADLLDGLGAAARSAGTAADLASVGIDSWGVDYGLISPGGGLLSNPVSYRDARTNGVMERVLAVVPAAELYAVTGAQQLQINTICQLMAASQAGELDGAATMLLIPDLLSYWLTGETGAELTNASTTQLFDLRARDWAWDVIGRLGLPRRLFPPLRQPGTVTGALRPDLGTEPGLAGLAGRLPVIAVGSHDTASAVAGVPAEGRDFAYISCGTWSLVGVELDRPVLSEASRAANFANETGVDGTIRYLRNVMGLWLLQESLRTWSADLGELLEAAARQEPLAVVIDVDDPVFLPPGDMPARIAELARRSGQLPPDGPAATVRCILDSLALTYRRAVAQVQELSGREAAVVHVVGGGARNDLLLQLTADACGRPVVAGPVEAAALGNVLVQARALNAGPPDLPGMRALLRATQPLRRFEPAGRTAVWEAAAGRSGPDAARPVPG